MSGTVWRFDPMNHNTPPEDLGTLQQLCLELGENLGRKPVCVEVGSWAGLTALFGLLPYSERVHCVDTWIGNRHDDHRHIAELYGPQKAFQTFCANMGPHLFREVWPHVGTSRLWSSVWPEPVDLVFIDAEHDYQSVLDDINLWIGHVRPGGVICGHDYSEQFDAVRRAVRHYFGNDFGFRGRVWWHQLPDNLGRALVGGDPDSMSSASQEASRM